MEITAMIKKTKDDIFKEITDVIAPAFASKGFQLRKNNLFEYNDSEGNLFQYEINLSKQKGYFSLHLMLNVFNKNIMEPINKILESVLRDDEYDYPDNWDDACLESTIKFRIKNKYLCGVTDWRCFKNEEESLSDFRDRFSIWFCVFDELDEKLNWKNQLIESVNMATYWFFEVYNKDWIIANTEYPSLYLLKKENRLDELKERYASIFPKARLKDELELFMKYLEKS
jgi:hypothetical protein